VPKLQHIFKILGGADVMMPAEWLRTHLVISLSSWYKYLLPPPCKSECVWAKSTCFIVLLLFLMFPNLKFIPAFNNGGVD
jgi:hypothetical protein